ncbi:hypothetical protein FRC10_011741, partial [Ceratobasidium sp. 414]
MHGWSAVDKQEAEWGKEVGVEQDNGSRSMVLSDAGNEWVRGEEKPVELAKVRMEGELVVVDGRELENAGKVRPEDTTVDRADIESYPIRLHHQTTASGVCCNEYTHKATADLFPALHVFRSLFVLLCCVVRCDARTVAGLLVFIPSLNTLVTLELVLTSESSNSAVRLHGAKMSVLWLFLSSIACHLEIFVMLGCSGIHFNGLNGLNAFVEAYRMEGEAPCKPDVTKSKQFFGTQTPATAKAYCAKSTATQERS